MEIPETVINKAGSLVETYGCHFVYLGLYEKKKTYKFSFPEKEYTGFPYVYLYNQQTNEVEEITGIHALRIIRKINME